MYIPLFILSLPALQVSQFDAVHELTAILDLTSNRWPTQMEGSHVFFFEPKRARKFFIVV